MRPDISKLSILFILMLSMLLGTSYSKEEPVSLKKMAGQMIMVGFRGPDITPRLKEQIAAGEVGGILILGDNIESRHQLKRLIGELKSIKTEHPLLIAIDQEGGIVGRLKASKGFEDFPSARRVAADMTAQEAYNLYSRMALLLKDLGINMNLAPVVDLDVYADSPAIGARQRSYSHDPAIVSKYSEAFIRAHDKAGILTVLKHFPGHGSAKDDTHYGMADVTKTWTKKELDPYKKLIGLRLAGIVMPAHIFNSNIDDKYPASLSKKTINGLLRKKLGFNGLVISDDMQMGAISKMFTFNSTVKNAVSAGNDILLFANYFDPDPEVSAKALAVMEAAVVSGELSIGDIKTAFHRVMEIKKKL